MNENAQPTSKRPGAALTQSEEQLAQWLLLLMREPQTAPPPAT